MFGVSFTELLLIGAVTLLVVGPDRLPQLLGTLGRWSAKLRRLTTEVRHQSGIDDILRKEGISGGLSELRELRNVARGDFSSLTKPKTPAATRAAPAATPSVPPAPAADADPFADIPYDRSREYPTEGCDAYGVIPDDLWHDPSKADAPLASESETTSSDPAEESQSEAAATAGGVGTEVQASEPSTPATAQHREDGSMPPAAKEGAG